MKSEKCKVLSARIKGASTRHDEIRTTPMPAERCAELHMQMGAMKSSFHPTYKDESSFYDAVDTEIGFMNKFTATQERKWPSY